MLSNELGKKAERVIAAWLDRPQEGYCFDRIPDQMTGMRGSTNICDFTLFKQPNFYYIESKSTYEDRFDFALVTQRNDMVKKAIMKQGVYGYLIILFASYQRAFIIDILDFDEACKQGIKSINIKKIDKWTIPYTEIPTVPSRKELLDYDKKWAGKFFS